MRRVHPFWFNQPRSISARVRGRGRRGPGGRGIVPRVLAEAACPPWVLERRASRHRGRKNWEAAASRPLGKSLSRSRGAATVRRSLAPAWGCGVGSNLRWHLRQCRRPEPCRDPTAKSRGWGGMRRQRPAGRAPDPASPPRLNGTRRCFGRGGVFCAPNAEGLLMPVRSPWQLQTPRKCHKTQPPAFHQQEVTELLPQGGEVLLF